MRLQRRAAISKGPGAGSETGGRADDIGGSGADGEAPPPFIAGGGPTGGQNGVNEGPPSRIGTDEDKNGELGIPEPSTTTTNSAATAIPILSSSATNATPSLSPSPAPQSPNTSRNNTPIIVGSVLGAVALLAVGAIVFFILRKRRRVAKDSDSAGFQPDRMVVAGIRVPSFMSRTRGYAKTPVEEDYPANVSGVGASHYSSYGPTRQVDWESPLTTTQPAFLIPAPYEQGSPADSSSFVPLPERQLELQELILQAQQKILRLGDSRRSSRVDDLNDADPEPEVLEARRLKARIRELERLKDSPWARGLTDVVPKELLKPI